MNEIIIDQIAFKNLDQFKRFILTSFIQANESYLGFWMFYNWEHRN